MFWKYLWMKKYYGNTRCLITHSLTFHSSIQVLNYSFPNLSYYFYLTVYSLKCMHVWFFFDFYVVYILDFLVSTVSVSGYFLITISKSHGQNFLCIVHVQSIHHKKRVSFQIHRIFLIIEKWPKFIQQQRNSTIPANTLKKELS